MLNIKNKYRPSTGISILRVLCFILLPVIILQAQEMELGNGAVLSGGAESVESGQYKSDILIGQPVIGQMNSASGSLGADLGQWSFFLLPPEAPTVSATDGTSSNKITISWSVDVLSPQASGETEVYRDSTKIATVGPGQNSYDDNVDLAPGEYYTYEVYVSNTYGQSPAGSDMGFINPNGKIMGRVSTTGGNPVVDVEVSLDPVLGTALSFDGEDDYVQVGTDGSMNISSEMTAEAWVKIPSTIPATQRVGLVMGNYRHLPNFNFEIYTEGRLHFSWNGGEVDAQVDSIDLRDDQWHHIAATRKNGDKLRLYIDGSLKGEFNPGSDADYQWPLRIGADFRSEDPPGIPFNGLIDDVRLWNTARTADDIQRNMQRTLSGNESGLQGYWKFDEGSDDYVFDLTANNNDGNLYGPAWSDDKAEVRVSAFTDSDGNYDISGIYYGEGQTFTVTPAKENHLYFNPANRQVYLDNDNRVVSEVNFIDESMMQVSGFVKFKGTSCFVEGAEILVDGHSHQPTTLTDENGEFVMDFEPGESHTLTAYYKGHSMEPADGISFENILQPLADLLFTDTQTFPLEVSVTGGKEKYPIGRFSVDLNSSNGCYSLRDTTSSSGYLRFAALPPMEYEVSLTAIDSVSINSDENFAANHVVSLEDTAQVLSVTWRAPLNVEIVGLPVHEMGKIVLAQNEYYEVEIKTYEKYGSNKSYIDSGQVSVTDAISNKDSEFDFPNNENKTTYRFLPYLPNLTANGSEHDYELNATFTVTDDLGRSKDNTIWAVVTGERARETSFTTTTPDIPLLVLHDPPGDGSYSYYSKESTYETAFTMTFAESEALETHSTASLGGDYTFETGVGFSVETELDVTLDYSASAEFSLSQEFAHEQTYAFSTSEIYSTTADDQMIGNKSDLFIGGALNLLYGLTDQLMVEDTTGNGDYGIKIYQSLIFVPDGFATTYMYTENYISTVLIPNLLQVTKDTAAAEQWQKILDNNEANRRTAEFDENISFSSGVNYEYTRSASLSKTNTYSFDMVLAEEIGYEAGYTVNGVGLVGGSTYKMTLGLGVSGSETSTKTTTSGYVLYDDDETSTLNYEADAFSVDIKRDPVYGTPVFELVSGRSSGPWEPNTTPREGVLFTADRYSATDVMPGEEAVFNLNLSNTSQTEEDRRYFLTVNQESNPNGARIRINGVLLEDAMYFDIPGTPGSNMIQAVMTVERGPEAYDYEGLQIKFYSEADDGHDGPDGHYFWQVREFDVHFVPPCTDLAIQNINDNWVINQSNHDTLEIILDSYDYGDENLEEFQIEYAEAGTQKWFPANGAKIDADSVNNSWLRLYWDASGKSDGDYQIRAVSKCRLVNGVTESIPGTIDRTSPVPFGSPQPTDGVLEANDLIEITFSEDIDTEALTVDNFELVNTETGSAVGFTWSASEKTIIIEISVANRFVENQHLRMTVDGVKDVYGNPLAEASVWEFTVNRNPVAWNSSEINEIIYVEDENSFSMDLRNIGSSIEDFEITDMPEWLSAMPAYGKLNAGGVQTVNFQVANGLNYGTYIDTVYAKTSMGNEPLIVKLNAMARPPEWEFHSAQYRYTMTITAELAVQGEVSEDIYDRVGAFVDGECRGKTQLKFEPGPNKYLAYLTVFSNSTSGEEITFRIWDNSGCCELWDITPSVEFESNSMQGTLAEPLLLDANGAVAQQIKLEAGWSWISLNLANEDNPFGDQINEISFTSGDRIIADTAFAEYAEGIGWVGPLMEAGFSNTAMYKIEVAEDEQIPYVGFTLDPQQIPIRIVSGWNWIGYTPSVNMPIDEALETLTPSELDLIKSQTSFAQYYKDYGWVGSLDKLYPGEGYMIKASHADTLIYPGNGTSSSPAAMLLAKKEGSQTQLTESPWEIDPRAYRFNMTVTAAIGTDSLEVLDENDVVVAFCGDEVRGMVRPVFIEQLDSWRLFMMLYSNKSAADELTFKIYDADEDITYRSNETLNFRANSVLGDVNQPLKLSKAPLRIGDKGYVPEEYSLGQNFPNPFNPSTSMGFGIPFASEVHIEVYNLLGQKVATLVSEKVQPGYQFIQWNSRNIHGQQVSSGIYFVVMRARSLDGSKQFNHTNKMILLR